MRNKVRNLQQKCQTIGATYELCDEMCDIEMLKNLY